MKGKSEERITAESAEKNNSCRKAKNISRLAPFSIYHLLFPDLGSSRRKGKFLAIGKDRQHFTALPIFHLPFAIYRSGERAEIAEKGDPILRAEARAIHRKGAKVAKGDNSLSKGKSEERITAEIAEKNNSCRKANNISRLAPFSIYYLLFADLGSSRRKGRRPSAFNLFSIYYFPVPDHGSAQRKGTTQYIPSPLGEGKGEGSLPVLPIFHLPFATCRSGEHAEVAEEWQEHLPFAISHFPFSSFEGDLSWDSLVF